MTDKNSTTLLNVAAWPIAGVIVTLNVVLALWARNIMRIGYESALPTILGVIAATALLTLVLRFVTGSWAKAGVATALIAIYFFYVPAIIDVIGASLSATVLMHTAAILLLYFIWRSLPKSEDRFATIARRINFICLILLAINLVPLTVDVVGLEQRRAGADSSFSPLEGTANEASPDVWHIIFDRYAANSTLQSRYGYDNSAFYDALRDRGFSVKEDAFSNYQRTGHSVASTMNGSMLDPLASAMEGGGERDWVPIYRAMRDGEAFKQFNRMGYRTVWAGSWWEPTRFSTVASESIQIRALPQLTRLMVRDSAVGFWRRNFDLPWSDDREDQCKRSSEKFDALANIAASDERKLVLGHFLIPHPPFVLNSDGSCKSLEDARATSRRDNYVDQVRFANDRVIELIDAILAGQRPAVIVIHSDEGPWPEPYVGNEHGLGTDPVPVPWADLTEEQMHEKFAILMAMRSPDGNEPAIMPQSPVQIYPAILREHFNSGLPLPRSEHVVFESKYKIYEFSDISSKLGLTESTAE